MFKLASPHDNRVFEQASGKTLELAALRLMLDAVRSASLMSRSDALTYALAWFAAGKLLATGKIAGYRDFSDLLFRDCWNSAERSGLPSDAAALVWSPDGHGRVPDLVNAKLASLLSDLVAHLPDREWDFSDAIAELIGTEAGGYDAGLCEAMVALLQAPPDAVVWIPFDVTGQLTITALKQGLKVVFDGPSQSRWSVLAVRLLAVIAGRSNQLSTDAGIQVSDTQETGGAFDYLIACPPIGSKLLPGTGWRKWESSELGLVGSNTIYKQMVGKNVVQLDRTESWSIAALWPRVRLKAVFLTGPNLLFAKGQEQRLREFLVLGLQQPSMVATLPPKLLHQSGIPVALTVLDRLRTTRSVRFIDANSITIESRSTMHFSRQLDSAKLIHTALIDEEIDNIAKTVSLDEVAAQECNLMPVRYLKALSGGDGDRVPLGDLVDVFIRAPVPSKDVTAVEAQEISIADLDRWNELQGPFTRTTTVQSRKLQESLLHHEDIVISIKGTIGKVGLIGVGAVERGSVVCGQTVVAIRPKRNEVETAALYLYLRSDDFKRQLEALRVGAAVAHVTPATLLQEIKIPRQILRDQAMARTKYAELCDLEREAERAYQRIEDIRRTL